MLAARVAARVDRPWGTGQRNLGLGKSGPVDPAESGTNCLWEMRLGPPASSVGVLGQLVLV